MKTFLALLFSVLVFAACSESKDNYVAGFNNFVEEVQVNAPNYTETDWEAANQKYDEFISIFQEKIPGKLTDADKQQINKQKVKYLGLRVAGKAKQAQDSLKSAIQKGVEKAEELQEGIE